MKGLLKWLFIAGVITAVIVVVTNKSRQRATAPAGPGPLWEPPTVTPTAEPGEAPAEPEARAEVAIDAEEAGELADALAAQQLADEKAIEFELEVADDEGMVAIEDAVVDIAIDSEGDPVISELAAPGIAEAFGATVPIEGEAEETDEAPDFGAMLDETVSELAAETSLEPAVAETEPGGGTDVLSEYFEKLAATPDGHPATEADAPADDDLPASVEEALEDLAPAPIVPPPKRNAESYLDEGNVYFNVGQYGLAIERYGQAIEMDDSLTAAFYNRANAHTRSGDFEAALADYNRALELQPRDADALNNRGMLHLYRSNFAEALADFNGALEADPTDTTVMVNRGLAHLHGGNAADALVDFREASAMDASDAAAQYGAAQASASLGNRDEALKHITRALELDPGYAREAAADPRLELLQGDEEFIKLLRESGTRSN